MKWISTKERLPEEGQEVLYVTTDIKETAFGEFYRSTEGKEAFGNLIDGYVSLAYVSYWMPIPTPPSEEEKTEEVREEKEFKVGMKVRVVKNLYEGEWRKKG